MTSFKKVKKLTRDWQVVRHALKLAPQLEVSPEGYRVKRRDILPELLRKPRLLTSVVAIRVPPDFDSVDKITSLFRSYGEIGLVRLLRPGKEVPSDLRNYATQVPDIGDSLCAVVDFEGSEAALKAVRELKEQFRNDLTFFNFHFEQNS
jgi:la-related protein 6